MNFLKRFKYAFSGLFFLLIKEKNFRLHLFLFALLIVAGIFFQLSKSEWIAILICSALVLCLEAVNTAFEKLADLIDPHYNGSIKIAKDIAAAGVLIAALFSVVVACIVFIPKICCYLR